MSAHCVTCCGWIKWFVGVSMLVSITCKLLHVSNWTTDVLTQQLSRWWWSAMVLFMFTTIVVVVQINHLIPESSWYHFLYIKVLRL